MGGKVVAVAVAVKSCQPWMTSEVMSHRDKLLAWCERHTLVIFALM